MHLLHIGGNNCVNSTSDYILLHIGGNNCVNSTSDKILRDLEQLKIFIQKAFAIVQNILLSTNYSIRQQYGQSNQEKSDHESTKA